jgi:hypothetical protein
MGTDSGPCGERRKELATMICYSVNTNNIISKVFIKSFYMTGAIVHHAENMLRL